MTKDKKSIKAIYATSAAALAGADFAILAECYSDNVIQFPPDAPPRQGWEAIKTALKKELAGITFRVNTDIAEIIVSGDWAFARGTFRGTAYQKKNDPDTETSGSFLDILQRQVDGSWKISRSTWTNHILD